MWGSLLSVVVFVVCVQLTGLEALCKMLKSVYNNFS